jgi:hypothetical protein
MWWLVGIDEINDVCRSIILNIASIEDMDMIQDHNRSNDNLSCFMSYHHTNGNECLSDNVETSSRGALLHKLWSITAIHNITNITWSIDVLIILQLPCLEHGNFMDRVLKKSHDYLHDKKIYILLVSTNKI